MSSKNSIHASEKQSENKARDKAEWKGRFRGVPEGVLGEVADVGSVSSSVSPASNTRVVFWSDVAFADKSCRSWYRL